MRKTLGLLAGLFLGGVVQAQDMALSQVLIDDEPWREVASGYGFTDGPCSDAEGNFYFTDVARGNSINKIDPDGNVSIAVANVPRISGLKLGRNGLFYAATQHPKKQIVSISREGEVKTILDEAEPNDLIVTPKGHIYFTQTGKKSIMFINENGNTKVVDTGINKPNGITVSTDGGTLAVSDFGGTNVWIFRIETDGTLSAKAPYMTTRALPGKSEAMGDGMTVDSAGRYFVSSEAGVQVFDPTGRMSGVILKPNNKFLASVAFAGKNHEYLYATCSDKVFRRKTKTTGVKPVH
ncbi:MAG: SMP-30/gluconolactonase/LRE family protein [Verrucomicrobiales bacterium]